MKILILTSVLIALVCTGCERNSQPTNKLPFDSLQLGISSDAATKLAGRDGKSCDHDQLPSRPLPRALYKSIPESTTWLVWWQEENGVPIRPELILGVLEGRIIYKQIMYGELSKPESSAWVLPEYQK